MECGLHESSWVAAGNLWIELPSELKTTLVAPDDDVAIVSLKYGVTGDERERDFAWAASELRLARKGFLQNVRDIRRLTGDHDRQRDIG